MKLHEYQAKSLFERFGIATPRGIPAATPEEAERAASDLKTSNLVVKAQIHAGGRGKGTFRNGFKGGVPTMALNEKDDYYSASLKLLSSMAAREASTTR